MVGIVIEASNHFLRGRLWLLLIGKINNRLKILARVKKGEAAVVHLVWQRPEPPLYPWLKLAGRWIEHAGFKAGQRVKINVENGRLTITAE